MKPLNYSAIAIILLSLVSCSKEYSLESGKPIDINAIKVDQFNSLIVEKKVQLKAFYSDTPIDYNETDNVVKEETDLWPYVSSWLKDDFTSFGSNGSSVTVEQNTVKMPGLNDDILHRSYTITKEDDGVYITFLDYQYQPLKYELYKVGVDYFILSIKWNNGATLFSRFELVK